MKDKDQIPRGQRIRHYVGELRRRHVVQVISVYLVAVWGLSAGAADIFDALSMPPEAARYFIIILFSLTPLVALFSWLFEVNTSGIHRDYGVSTDDSIAGSSTPESAEGLITASFKGTTRSFNSDFTVGRDESCEFQIIDPLISRKHTRFECVDKGWQVRDLGSANGTTIDGRKVETAIVEGRATVHFYPGCPDFNVATVVDTTADTVFAEA